MLSLLSLFRSLRGWGFMLLIFFCSFVAWSCATIVNAPHQKVPISSSAAEKR